MNLAGLPASLLMTEAVETPEAVVLQAQDLRTEVCCPDCGAPSRHLHSRYPRTLHDTALGDRPVVIHLQVRRLRCLNPACRRTTFAETWPEWLRPRAQRTTRLAQLQRAVGVALGGEAGHRLLRHLHEVTSADTLLRLIRCHPLPTPPDLHVLGVDDFSFRRGQTYGTLLIDLERRQVVDVLPDRTAETLATWLARHPGIRIISRDRFGEYARGAATGAPQAQQIADRFHLVKNLREVAEHWFQRLRVHRLPPPPADQGLAEPVDVAPVAEPFKQDAVPTTTSARVRRVIGRRAHRRTLYERAAALHAQGHSVSATARLTGVGRSTLQDWFKAEGFPRRATRRGGLTPFVDYVRERLKTVDVSAQRLYDELVQQGFRGHRSAVNQEFPQAREQRPARRPTRQGLEIPRSHGP